ncbi:cytochrome P450 [Nocardia bovistercoris]|uniref:Cytochrome P450 n=1 Tax=Nocardia bovistercoris TaxID=2785916 RepID=A0A931I7P2_9NOCA|nr:cytochrome P450 [Nocardia bovistercoris]MBH0775277.1 cytochrome P450 [Nocardia bovistercoris]
MATESAPGTATDGAVGTATDGAPGTATDGAFGTKGCPIQFERHTVDFRDSFVERAAELHSKCPMAWSDSYGGYWVASDMPKVFAVARDAELLSSDYDGNGERKGYKGILIPGYDDNRVRSGFIEMDPPEQQDFRKQLNPYLSPAAVARWVPVIDELTRACIDEVIETGRIDFIDDLANIVPAVLTMGLLGMPLADWEIFCEPVHAQVYTDPTSPAIMDVMQKMMAADAHLGEWIAKIRTQPRPGLINALNTLSRNGELVSEADVLGSCQLLIGGGFDTTTALSAHALEWLSQHPEQREQLSENLETMLDSATEEFLRFYTPAQGNGRTVARNAVVDGVELREGDRLWLSWAMANRDAEIFPDPNEVDLHRTGNRHTSFGLGVHRCIGSNVARNLFKRMLTQVLERMPDYVCDAAGAMHYPSVGIINGMQKLPATFTPGARVGDGLQDTIARMQRVVDEQRLAEPITKQKAAAQI